MLVGSSGQLYRTPWGAGMSSARLLDGSRGRPIPCAASGFRATASGEVGQCPGGLMTESVFLAAHGPCGWHGESPPPGTGHGAQRGPPEPLDLHSQHGSHSWGGGAVPAGPGSTINTLPPGLRSCSSLRRKYTPRLPPSCLALPRVSATPCCLLTAGEEGRAIWCWDPRPSPGKNRRDTQTSHMLAGCGLRERGRVCPGLGVHSHFHL